MMWFCLFNGQHFLTRKSHVTVGGTRRTETISRHSFSRWNKPRLCQQQYSGEKFHCPVARRRYHACNGDGSTTRNPRKALVIIRPWKPSLKATTETVGLKAGDGC